MDTGHRPPPLPQTFPATFLLAIGLMLYGALLILAALGGLASALLTAGLLEAGLQLVESRRRNRLF